MHKKKFQKYLTYSVDPDVLIGPILDQQPHHVQVNLLHRHRTEEWDTATPVPCVRISPSHEQSLSSQFLSNLHLEQHREFQFFSFPPLRWLVSTSHIFLQVGRGSCSHLVEENSLDQIRCHNDCRLTPTFPSRPPCPAPRPRPPSQWCNTTNGEAFSERGKR